MSARLLTMKSFWLPSAWSLRPRKEYSECSVDARFWRPATVDSSRYLGCGTVEGGLLWPWLSLAAPRRDASARKPGVNQGSLQGTVAPSSLGRRSAPSGHGGAVGQRRRSRSAGRGRDRPQRQRPVTAP